MILSGIRILDLTRVMSGPFATAMLADLGAEVIKVELPGAGDDARMFAPHVDGESAYFALLNRGKKSVALDLKSDEGRALARKIAASCDVVVENFRPGVAKRLGLDHESLRAGHPALIYASISGFGQEGPLAGQPAFDLVIQAMSGLMSLTGEREGRALPAGESFADIATGMFASWGILAALFDRERTGEGRYLEVAMLDSVVSMLLTGLARQLYTGRPATRVGARHPETYPVDSFEARDGAFVLVGFSPAATRGIFAAMGEPALEGDPRFATNAARNRNEAALRDLIAAWAAGRTRDEALAALAENGVPAGPVLSLSQMLDLPHVRQRGLVTTGRSAKLGEVPLVPQPVRFAGADRPEGQNVPGIGEDSDRVLAELAGLSPEAIADLRQRKIIA